MVIELSTLGLFALSAAVLTLIPGADMLCALSNAVSQGNKSGADYRIGGGHRGDMPCLFCDCRRHGSDRLFAAAVSAFRHRRRAVHHVGRVGHFTQANAIGLENHGERKSRKRLYSQGFLTNLLNPKAIIFMLAFIPQFIRVEAGRPGIQMLILGIELILIMFLIEVPLVFLAGRIALRIKRRPAIGIYINKCFGGVILLLACAILAARLC